MIYSSNPLNFGDQVAEMIQRGVFFTPMQPVWIARAPGRLDLMGGNVDYTGGLVLQLPLREAVWAAVQPTPGPTICVLNPGAAQFGWKTTLEIHIGELSSLEAIEAICERSPGFGWGRYVLGAFHLLNQRYGSFADRGANLFLASDLPPNRGVASSAALEIATLKAASAAVGIALDGVALAGAGQWVENVVAHSACGIMDQAAIVLGQRNCLLPLICQPCSRLPPIPLPKELRVWGIDSMVSRSTNDDAYESARAAAFIGYKMICQWECLDLALEQVSGIPRWTDPRWKGYLSNIPPSEFRSRYERRLPESFGGCDFLRLFDEHLDPFTSIDPDHFYPVRAAVRYAIEENLRIETVKMLLETLGQREIDSTLRLIGELQFQSHLAYTECGLGASACDDLVALARRLGFFGAKMTGGGGGGVVAVLGLAHQENTLKQMVAEYAAQRGGMPHVFEGSSDGTDISGACLVEAAMLTEHR
jgi:L-arabinokinase